MTPANTTEKQGWGTEMLRFLKRRRPQYRVADTRLDVRDLLIARWHGLSEAEWCALPAIVKVDKREAYYRAWGLGA
jgi:hypothetical protein